MQYMNKDVSASFQWADKASFEVEWANGAQALKRSWAFEGAWTHFLKRKVDRSQQCPVSLRGKTKI